MRRVSILAASALLAVGTVSSGAAVAQESQGYGPPDEVTHWLFAPAFGPSDAGWDLGIMPWVEAVEEATKGTVQIEVKPAGTLVSSSEAFAAAVAGVTDVYAGWATVYGGSMPAGLLAYGMPMGAPSSKAAWTCMWGDPDYRIGELVQKAAHQHNLHWAGWTNQGPNAWFTTFPVHSVEDLKGKKMRAGGPQAIFHAAMGGVPVSMSPGQIYTAIELGTIAGTYWDTGGSDDMSFPEVVDYAIMPGWNPAQHQSIYINLGSWKALNEWQRDQIEGLFKSHYFKTSKLHAQGVDEALGDLKEAGGEVIHLSDQAVADMRIKAVEDVWPKIADQSEITAKGVKIWKECLTDLGVIGGQ